MTPPETSSGSVMPPVVSAIVSTYKSERFMRGLLEDLEAQTIADRLEIVIVDSNSPQSEGAMVKEFQERYDNIAYLRTPERETSHAAFNRCMKMARGKYITLACTDDRHKADAFERMAAVLESRPDIALVYANSHITLAENETFNKNTAAKTYRWLDFDPLALLSGCFMGPQPMWRRCLHERYGYLDGSLESAGDWEFWLRLAEKERFLHIDEILGLYLYSETSSEHKNPERHQREVDQVKARYMHRRAGLQERQRRSEEGVPADKGLLALVLSDEESGETVEGCVEHLRGLEEDMGDLSVRVAKRHGDVAENALDVNVSPKTMTAVQAVNEAARWESRYTLLLSPSARPTEACIRTLLSILQSNDGVAAAGPLPAPDAATNTRADESWSEVHALPCFCLLLDNAPLREAGGLHPALPLRDALLDLFRRLRNDGHRVACARSVRMQHDVLSAREAVLLDDLARAETALNDDDIETARQGFNSALEKDSTCLHAQVGIAETLRRHGDLQQAMVALKHTSQQYPGNVDVLAGFARLSLDLGAIESAQKALQHIQSVAKTHPATLTLERAIRRVEQAASC